MAASQPEPPHIPATETRLALGRRGEELAAAFLQQSGFQLVAANFEVAVGRNRNGALINVEIDLIAYEGPTLCFVEVKTRASDWFAPPSRNVDLRKQRQITRAARAYRRMFGLTDANYRYDVVSIVLPTSKESDSAHALADSAHVTGNSCEATVSRKEAGTLSLSLQIDLIRDFWSEDKFRKRRWPERHWD